MEAGAKPLWQFEPTCAHHLPHLRHPPALRASLPACHPASCLPRPGHNPIDPSLGPPQFSFAVMTGPLMWSIVAMRNSLVFHDGDKITTLMMHASPALSAWWVGVNT